VANHPQALRRHKQSLKRRARNRHGNSNLKSTVKAVREAIDNGESADQLEPKFREAESLLHRMGQKGVLKPETASRRVGRLAKAVANAAVSVEKPKAKPKESKAAARKKSTARSKKK
jgi:small subunit ribosomal protein S20